jgi:chromosomal replication initiator protein
MSNTNTELNTTLDPFRTWKECLKIIRENVPFITYNTWFLPIKPFEIEDNLLKVKVPNSFFVEWIDEHYNTLINKTLNQVLGETAKLVYVVGEETEENLPVEKIEENEKKKVEEPAKKDYESFINPRYVFENFIKGEGNQLARAAAFAVGDNPGETSFNPLFIYGGVGLGKTHLIQAIGNRI